MRGADCGLGVARGPGRSGRRGDCCAQRVPRGLVRRCAVRRRRQRIAGRDAGFLFSRGGPGVEHRGARAGVVAAAGGREGGAQPTPIPVRVTLSRSGMGVGAPGTTEVSVVLAPAGGEASAGSPAAHDAHGAMDRGRRRRRRWDCWRFRPIGVGSRRCPDARRQRVDPGAGTLAAGCVHPAQGAATGGDGIDGFGPASGSRSRSRRRPRRASVGVWRRTSG